MKTTLLTVMTATALLFCARGAQAELKWEQKEIEIKPGFSDEQAVAMFKYENTGPDPVRILNVKSSCGCTVAQLKSTTIQPGEKGELTATFKFGNRVGMQQKSVHVQTDDAANPSTVLLLRATIPALDVQPKVVFWQGDEPLQPKIITVTAPPDAPIQNIVVTSSSNDFATKIEANRGAKEWKISVTPKDNTQTRQAVFTIKTDQPNSNRTYLASARVIKTS